MSQEEEEARVDFGKKEAVFTEEIARLQASLKAERTAVVEARKDNGNEGKREVEGYLRWVDFYRYSYLVAVAEVKSRKWEILYLSQCGMYFSLL